jgi:hypothetical protein
MKQTAEIRSWRAAAARTGSRWHSITSTAELTGAEQSGRSSAQDSTWRGLKQRGEDREPYPKLLVALGDVLGGCVVVHLVPQAWALATGGFDAPPAKVRAWKLQGTPTFLLIVTPCFSQKIKTSGHI